jgi:hypothetical protein
VITYDEISCIDSEVNDVDTYIGDAEREVGGWSLDRV